MANVGLVTVPAATGTTPAGDPLLQRVGDFLAAAINAGCYAAWQEVASGEPVVRTVQTNDPSDNTFCESDLPALFVYRGKMPRNREGFCADFSREQTKLTVLWVPHVAVQDWKAQREPFFHTVESAIMTALQIDRTPGWVLAGDTDPLAAVEGSILSKNIGVQTPGFFTQLQFENVDLVIKIDMQPDRNYPALRASMTIYEDVQSGALGELYPASTDVTILNAEDEETGVVEDLPT